jgi:hypothetical protein
VKFLIEFAWAALLVGAPIGVFTLALVWWALQGGHLKESGNASALMREMQAMSRSAKKKKHKKDVEQEEKTLHPLQKKWAKFGGGFYGIVAFFTYIVVETLEVINMITHLGGFIAFIKNFNPDVIVQLFVGALMNFLTAIAWPLYWLKRIETDQVWLWFVVAYAGYWAGLKLAQVLIQRRSQVLT